MRIRLAVLKNNNNNRCVLDYENVDVLINPEYCGCEIATLTKSDTSFIDSMVTEESGEYAYYYQIRVNSGSYGRNSSIDKYTIFNMIFNITYLNSH